MYNSNYYPSPNLNLKFSKALLVCEASLAFRQAVEVKVQDTFYLNPEVISVMAIPVQMVVEAKAVDRDRLLQAGDFKVFIVDRASGTAFYEQGWAPMSDLTRESWWPLKDAISFILEKHKQEVIPDSWWFVLATNDTGPVESDKPQFSIPEHLNGSLVRVVDALQDEHIGRYGIVDEQSVNISGYLVDNVLVEKADPYFVVKELLSSLSPAPEYSKWPIPVLEYISDIASDFKSGKEMFHCSWGYEEGFLLPNYTMLLILEELLRVRSMATGDDIVDALRAAPNTCHSAPALGRPRCYRLRELLAMSKEDREELFSKYGRDIVVARKPVGSDKNFRVKSAPYSLYFSYLWFRDLPAEHDLEFHFIKIDE